MTPITSDGRRLGGQYSVAGQEVQLNYKIGSQSILITLTYGTDKAQLYARSARTGNTAVYEKRPSRPNSAIFRALAGRSLAGRYGNVIRPQPGRVPDR